MAKITYRVDTHEEDVDKEKLDADTGVCDAIIVLHVDDLKGGKERGMKIKSVEGTTGEPVETQGMFMAWIGFSKTLAADETIPEPLRRLALMGADAALQMLNEMQSPIIVPPNSGKITRIH